MIRLNSFSLSFALPTICLALFATACNRNDSISGTPPIGTAKSDLDPSEENLATSQIKLAYLGPQSMPVINVAFYTDKSRFDLDRFDDFQKSGISYSSDGGGDAVRFTVTPSEMRRIVLAIDPLLSRRKLRGWKDTKLACVLVYESNGSYKGGEYFIENKDTQKFYKTLIGALDLTNKTGREILTRYGEIVVSMPTYSGD
ncbi:MAG: hypothetical protein ACJ8FY_14250 [Gemmataceae bacterium]